MNYAAVISFTVGGILLISVIALNNQVMLTSSDTTMNMIAKRNLDNVADYVVQDFRQIGYNSDINQPISAFTSQKIQFWGGMESSIDNNRYRVTYEADPNDKVTSSKNPDDYYLERRVERYSSGSFTLESTSRFPVNHFELNYFTLQGKTATTAGQIRTIHAEIICETPEPIQNTMGGDPVYERAIWKQNISPDNLQIY